MKKIFLLTIIISFFWSCKKNDNAPPDRLPNITTTGANTFGCMINGELWIPRIEGSNPGNHDEIKASYLTAANSIFIRGLRITDDEDDQDLGISISEVVEDTIYNFEKTNITSYNFGCGDRYSIDTNLPYEVIILKHDSENLVVSGTFNFILIREDDDCLIDTLNVTEGRFDIAYDAF